MELTTEKRSEYEDICPAFGKDPEASGDVGYDSASEECVVCGRVSSEVRDACAADCDMKVPEDQQTTKTVVEDSQTTPDSVENEDQPKDDSTHTEPKTIVEATIPEPAKEETTGPRPSIVLESGDDDNVKQPVTNTDQPVVTTEPETDKPKRVTDESVKKKTKVQIIADTINSQNNFTIDDVAEAILTNQPGTKDKINRFEAGKYLRFAVRLGVINEITRGVYERCDV